MVLKFEKLGRSQRWVVEKMNFSDIYISFQTSEQSHKQHMSVGDVSLNEKQKGDGEGGLEKPGVPWSSRVVACLKNFHGTGVKREVSRHKYEKISQEKNHAMCNKRERCSGIDLFLNRSWAITRVRRSEIL